MSVWLLACTVLVCVVLVGIAQGWAMVRKPRATDEERKVRQQRSVAVSQLIVGGAAMLAFMGLGLLVAWA